MIPRAPDVKRGFNIDIQSYRTCAGAFKVSAGIAYPLVIDNLLTHLAKKTAQDASTP